MPIKPAQPVTKIFKGSIPYTFVTALQVSAEANLDTRPRGQVKRERPEPKPAQPVTKIFMAFSSDFRHGCAGFGGG